MFINVCRVCLDSDVTMYSIVNTELQETYERLAKTTLDAEDGRPVTVCYICCSQLWSCYTISKISRKSDKILTKLLQNSDEVTKDTINLLKNCNGMQKKLSVNLVAHFEILNEELINDENTEDTNISISLREEETFNSDKEPPAATYINTKIKSKKKTEGKRCKYNKIPRKTRKPKDLSPYLCIKCKKIYIGIRKFNVHLKLHREKTIACNICFMKFNSQQAIKKHARVHVAKSFVCEVCGKAFRTNVHVKRHMIVHSGDKPFTCNLCGKSFRHKDTLKLHLQIHTGEKQEYICDCCTKLLSSKAALKTHMLTHTGEKPHSCNECGRKYRMKKNLIEHIRVHSGEKPYTCNVCNKSFLRKYALVYHQRVHSRERPYSCTICNRKFYDKLGLERHNKVHTGDRPYVCEICGKTYIQKWGLGNHMKTHHTEYESETKE